MCGMHVMHTNIKELWNACITSHTLRTFHAYLLCCTVSKWNYVCYCMHACTYVCMYICMYVCLYVCMYVCRYNYICMYESMYVCRYVCMYVCMCVYMYANKLHKFEIALVCLYGGNESWARSSWSWKTVSYRQWSSLIFILLNPPYSLRILFCLTYDEGKLLWKCFGQRK